MTVWNTGSINGDFFYSLPHLPAAGETLAALGFSTGLGGKGANQSVAAARAGSRVEHIGAVGPDGRWAVERMEGYGVGTAFVRVAEVPTGHAIINLDAGGENTIVVFAGANRALRPGDIEVALAGAVPGDILLLQNETNCQVEAAKAARTRGLRVIYSAAPFQAASVEAILGVASVLVMNQIEAAQLEAETGRKLMDLPAEAVLVTLGAEGAVWHDLAGGGEVRVPALRVEAVDTTGAGDTFAGYVAAALDQGLPVSEALDLATRAAALKVTRHGTADAIPPRSEVEAFRP